MFAEEKPQSDSDVVNFKIVAQIEEVTVILSSMGRHVGKVDVEGQACLLSICTVKAIPPGIKCTSCFIDYLHDNLENNIGFQDLKSLNRYKL